MSAQIAPGSWSYSRNPEGTRWIIDSEPDRAIACTAGFEPDNEAHARLFAASKLLLEALEFGEKLYGLEGPSRWPIEDRIRFDELAKAAIARAKGAA